MAYGSIEAQGCKGRRQSDRIRQEVGLEFHLNSLVQLLCQLLYDLFRIRFVTEKGDRLLDLGEDMLKPTNGSHDFGRPVLKVEESEEFFLVSLINPPKPENHLYMRPQPLDSSPDGDELVAFHRYSTANGYPFPVHRFELYLANYYSYDLCLIQVPLKSGTLLTW